MNWTDIGLREIAGQMHKDGFAHYDDTVSLCLDVSHYLGIELTLAEGEKVLALLEKF